MKNSKYCIGVDLGGTNIAVGLVDLETRQIVKKDSVKTNAPRSCEEISDDVVTLTKKFCSLEGIRVSDLLWIGASAPGTVKDGVVVSAVNLGWTNAPFAEILSRKTGVATYLSNDANSAAYAEALWGAGEGASSLIAFTLGTGVGGGIVFDGRIWEGNNGFAGELGHMIIEPNGRPCGCGKRGCIEAYASATALVSRTKHYMSLHKESEMWNVACGNIDRVNGKTAFTALMRGDRTAGIVIDEFIGYFAIAVSNVINIFQPDVVCIGGGISREGDNLMKPLCEKVSSLSFGTDARITRLVVASFRNDAGIIGSALLGLESKKFKRGDLKNENKGTAYHRTVCRVRRICKC